MMRERDRERDDAIPRRKEGSEMGDVSFVGQSGRVEYCV